MEFTHSFFLPSFCVWVAKRMEELLKWRAMLSVVCFSVSSSLSVQIWTTCESLFVHPMCRRSWVHVFTVKVVCSFQPSSTFTPSLPELLLPAVQQRQLCASGETEFRHQVAIVFRQTTADQTSGGDSVQTDQIGPDHQTAVLCTNQRRPNCRW